MEKFKLIIMSVSTVFVLIAGCISAWMAWGLPAGHKDKMFFVVAAVLCLLAFVWFGLNALNLWKEQKKKEN